MFLLTHLHEQVVMKGQFLKWSLTRFSFSKTGCHTKVKEPSLPYNLLTA